jgi:hypothetical protein
MSMPLDLGGRDTEPAIAHQPADDFGCGWRRVSNDPS